MLMRKMCWFALGVLQCFGWAGPAIAVLDLSGGQGFAPGEVQAITERLTTELIRLRHYQVLDRAQMDAILKEQGFQQTGACASTECQVQMGQLLGVEYLVSGSLSKVGSVITLNTRMIDVRTGRIPWSQALDIRGEVEDVLLKGCQQMAQWLSQPEAIGGEPVAASTGAPVEIKENTSSSAKWWWIAGGVATVAAVGTVTYVLLNGDAPVQDPARETRTVELDPSSEAQ